MTKKVLFVCIYMFFVGFSVKAGSHLRIVHISDVQLGFTEARALEAGKAVAPGSDARYFEKAVEIINNINPKVDIVVNTGDLVNDPANRTQWDHYFLISKKLHPRIYEVMGNHDGWTSEGVDDFRKRFRRNDFYTFVKENCRFIVLNSWYLKDPGSNDNMSKLQKRFLEDNLKNDKSAFRVIMLHFPLYINEPEEDDAYFNLPASERQWLLDMAVKYKVKLILSGHSHRNIVKKYKDSVTLITTGPVSEPLGLNDDNSVSKRGYRIIDIDPIKGTFTHEFIPLPEDTVTGNDFSFLFLGDLHFDRKEHHDLEWVLKAHPGDTSQIRQYSYRTLHYLPALYNEVAQVCRKDISFIVQTGDFTEGLCGNYALAEKQKNDFIRFTDSIIPVPFLISKGNHDITGPGADSSYKTVILPFLSKETGSKVNESNYVYIKNKSAFFFYDSFNKTSPDWLKEQMEKYAHMPVKFVVMHEPVVPVNGRSKWFELSGINDTKARQELLDLLAENNAIVIAGHMHVYALVLRKTPKGRFIQLSGSSVLDDLNQKPDKILTGADSYGPSLVDMEPDFSLKDRDERIAILSSEKTDVLYYEHANLQGYIVIHVTGNKVTADLYTGTGFQKWKTIDISGLLKDQRR